jgi:hypothetical protein
MEMQILKQLLRFSNRQVKNVKNIMEDEFSFPIGYQLEGLLAIEDTEFGGDEICLDRVELIFRLTQDVIILQPLADTDEINISIKSIAKIPTHKSASLSLVNNPTWIKPIRNSQ